MGDQVASVDALRAVAVMRITQMQAAVDLGLQNCRRRSTFWNRPASNRSPSASRPCCRP
ncbi:MAG: hypothetical protein MZV49_27240 [Rhodopseudomonas palustris]|nr:hypothetical protein [Rhodopseudomonas palustris]